MKVNPVQLDACSSCNFSWIQTSSVNKATDLFNTINGVSVNKPNIFQYTSKPLFTPQDEIIQDYSYVNTFLQYGNPIIKNLVMKIISSSDSDDVKMQKIQSWVYHNIEYMEDKEQYGYSELWVPPTMLLKTKKGDCEDQAFLIISLGLNAGVNPNKLRFYAGIVKAGKGSATGGHGWVAYKRDSDKKWVAVDSTYYPDLREMSKRIPLSNDKRYIDDYFIFEIGKVIITTDTNRVRNPDTYFNNGYMKPNILLPGNYINQYA
jgi:predicted transglutaminase-like cysteine proteinase